MDDNKLIIFKELLTNQKKNIIHNKLNYNDLKRISNFLNKSIFDKDECSLWNGSVIKINGKHYVNFFHNGKKKSIQRLLYQNFIDNDLENNYIHFDCLNKGLCCNIHHFRIKNNKKKKINKKKKPIVDEKENLVITV